jgi:glycosyltransferase involved in cell wall biosynthesis
MPPWKILLVNDHSFNHSGTPRYLVDVVSALDRDAFQPVVACPAPGPLPDELRGLGVPVIIVPMTPLTRETVFSFGREVAADLRLLRREGIELVHLNTLGWRDSMVLAAWLSNIPVVVHAHNPMVESVMHGNLNVALADRIVLNAHAAGRPYADHQAIAVKFVTAYNGVDLKAYPAKGSIRAELGLTDDALVVGTVGQVCERKGIDLFLSMAAAVLERFPETHFLVVGRDAVGQEGYTERMRALARRLGIDHRVRFTGHRTDVPEVMRSLDVFVLASRIEPFGRVILEALASGCAVVSTEVGGVPEILTRPEVGLRVQAEDASAMAAAVISLLEDPVRRAAMGKAGRDHVASKFSLEQVTRDLEAVYRELLTKRDASSARFVSRYRTARRKPLEEAPG